MEPFACEDKKEQRFYYSKWVPLYADGSIGNSYDKLDYAERAEPEAEDYQRIEWSVPLEDTPYAGREIV